MVRIKRTQSSHPSTESRALNRLKKLEFGSKFFIQKSGASLKGRKITLGTSADQKPQMIFNSLHGKKTEK